MNCLLKLMNSKNNNIFLILSEINHSRIQTKFLGLISMFFLFREVFQMFNFNFMENAFF